MLFGRRNQTSGTAEAATAPPPAEQPPASAAQTIAQINDAPTFSPLASKDTDMNAPTVTPVLDTVPPQSSSRTDVPRKLIDRPVAVPRRMPESASAPKAPAAVAEPAPAPAEPRRLIVGRGISLSGEIGACDALVIEGTVSAKLHQGQSLEIAESGLFNGSVEVQDADIGGRFEGSITVRGRLTVRATGKVTGSIKYGELGVEAGGQLAGDIQSVTPASTNSAAKPAAAPLAAAATAFAGAAE